MSTQAKKSRWISVIKSKEKYGRGDLMLLNVSSPLCEAVISLQGAQVLSFKPKPANNTKEPAGDLLWLSPLATLEHGTAIRGGVPVCAPWFGVNRRDSSLPKHGFVRNKPWKLVGATEKDHGECVIEFEYRPDANDKTVFAYNFLIQLQIVVSRQLEHKIRISNTGTTPLPLSWALHSYLAVNDIDSVSVTGLEDERYLDATDHLSQQTQHGLLRFAGEVDRVYEGVRKQQQLLLDEQPALNILGSDCPTVITWNPGESLAARMADIQQGFRNFVCIERGAAFADELRLAPGKHTEAIQILSAAK